MPHSPFIQISMKHDFHHIGILHPLTHQKRSAKFSGILHKKIHDLHTSSPSFSRRNGPWFPHGFSHTFRGVCRGVPGLHARSAAREDLGARQQAPGLRGRQGGAEETGRLGWKITRFFHDFHGYIMVLLVGEWVVHHVGFSPKLILVVGTKWVINDGLILVARTLWPILVGNGW